MGLARSLTHSLTHSLTYLLTHTNSLAVELAWNLSDDNDIGRDVQCTDYNS